MNVLFLTRHYPPHSAGVGNYVFQMARALQTAGHGVVVATAKVKGAQEEEATEAGCILRCFDEPEIGTHNLASRIIEISRTMRCDWIEGADHLGECAELLQRKKRPPVVIKSHSSNAVRVLRRSEAFYRWQHITQGLALLRAWKQCRREYQCLVRADALLAPSTRLMEELEAQFGRLPERRAVIPNPMMVESCVKRHEEAPTPTLLFAGRLSMGKGIASLPGILAATQKVFPEVRLRVAGPDGYARGLGSLKRWMERRFGVLNDIVDWLGELSAEQLKTQYRQAWVTLVPSRWDNFPNTVLEAMSLARPVAASPHGGMPEMLEGTTNAVALPESPEYISWIVRALSDKEFRRVAGESGRAKLVHCYAPGKIARKYIETLEAWA